MVSQNATFFHEPVHMMGEVIIKWFYFYYFRFRQLFERALLKNQNQNLFTWGAVNLRNAAKNYKKKSRIFWLDQNMKNDVNSQEMLCNKISKNPRIFLNKFSAAFLQLTALHVKKKWVWFLSNARSNSGRNRK